MYERGSERIDKEMDMLKIIRNIRSLRIWTRMNTSKEDLNKVKYLIRHSKKNLIDLDKDSDGLSSESVIYTSDLNSE